MRGSLWSMCPPIVRELFPLAPLGLHHHLPFRWPLMKPFYACNADYCNACTSGCLYRRWIGCTFKAVKRACKSSFLRPSTAIWSLPLLVGGCRSCRTHPSPRQPRPPSPFPWTTCEPFFVRIASVILSGSIFMRPTLLFRRLFLRPLRMSCPPRSHEHRRSIQSAPHTPSAKAEKYLSSPRSQGKRWKRLHQG